MSSGGPGLVGINTQFMALKIKDAICDRLRREQGARPNVDSSLYTSAKSTSANNSTVLNPIAPRRSSVPAGSAASSRRTVYSWTERGAVVVTAQL